MFGTLSAKSWITKRPSAVPSFSSWRKQRGPAPVAGGAVQLSADPPVLKVVPEAEFPYAVKCVPEMAVAMTENRGETVRLAGRAWIPESRTGAAVKVPCLVDVIPYRKDRKSVV